MTTTQQEGLWWDHSNDDGVDAGARVGHSVVVVVVVFTGLGVSGIIGTW